MTETFPWEKTQKSVAAQAEFDPFVFVRLRIQHGSEFRLVGIRADDSDITGKIPLDDGSVIVISVWGVPTKNEVFLKCDDVLKEIANYVRDKGLTIS